MKASILALAACVASCCAVAPPSAPRGSRIAALESETVALVAESKAYCSGVWTSAHGILTAAHCVADLEVGQAVHYAMREDVWHVGGEEYVTEREATLVRVDADHDLALLSVTIPLPHSVAPVATGPVTQGERVYTMGAPLGLWWSYSSGEVAAVRFLDDPPMPSQWWVQTTAPISPGNSGCGLFDEAGELIGIAHGYFPRGENLNLFVHREYVSFFVNGR